MPQPIDPRRRCLPLQEWPAAERAAWDRAIALAQGRFSARGPAADLSPATLEKAREGYGRWLTFLGHQGWLDPAVGPADRPSEARAAAYFDELRALGNRDHTIVGRFLELRSALAIMAPGTDFSWLSRPGGVPLRRRLAMARRPVAIHHSANLFTWGLEMMQRAVGLAHTRRRRILLRDGLMIALLSLRGMRLRSLVALRLGQQLRRDGDEWRIVLEVGNMKTRRLLEYPVPARLTPWMDRYLSVERAELLAGRTQDAVWIGLCGAPLSAASIEGVVRLRSGERFGPENAFGPHHFRHCIGTTGPMADPTRPAVSAAVLGISGRVHRKHYDRGGRAMAGQAYNRALEEDREEARAVLRRLAPQHDREHGKGQQGDLRQSRAASRSGWLDAPTSGRRPTCGQRDRLGKRGR